MGCTPSYGKWISRRQCAHYTFSGTFRLWSTTKMMERQSERELVSGSDRYARLIPSCRVLSIQLTHSYHSLKWDCGSLLRWFNCQSFSLLAKIDVLDPFIITILYAGVGSGYVFTQKFRCAVKVYVFTQVRLEFNMFASEQLKVYTVGVSILRCSLLC